MPDYLHYRVLHVMKLCASPVLPPPPYMPVGNIPTTI